MFATDMLGLLSVQIERRTLPFAAGRSTLLDVWLDKGEVHGIVWKYRFCLTPRSVERRLRAEAATRCDAMLRGLGWADGDPADDDVPAGGPITEPKGLDGRASRADRDVECGVNP